MVHIYNGVLVTEKNETMPFAATWIDLEISIPCEVSHRHVSNLWLPKEKGGEERNKEGGINIYTLLCIKQITNKDLLFSTGNYTIL